MPMVFLYRKLIVRFALMLIDPVFEHATTERSLLTSSQLTEFVNNLGDNLRRLERDSNLVHITGELVGVQDPQSCVAADASGSIGVAIGRCFHFIGIQYGCKYRNPL